MGEHKRYTAREMRKIANVFFCGRGHDLLDGRLSFYKISKEGLAEMLRQAADAEEELAKVKARLEAVAKECERDISFRQKTAARCEMCLEDSSAGEDCEYNGEPCGCNSPTYGEFPTEKECEPFKAILRVARGEGGAE